MPEDLETVLVAPVAAVASEVLVPGAVSLREVGDRADLDRIGAMEDAIWHDGRAGWLAEASRRRRPPIHTRSRSSSPSRRTRSSARGGALRVGDGVRDAVGGGTLPEWRGRGIYRALVAHRATIAAERGARHLQVDASSDSRPILQRLGFVAITTTTPFIWTPAAEP